MNGLRLRIAVSMVVAILALLVSAPCQSADCDLAVTNAPPGSIPLGVPFSVEVGYANLGPDVATSAYVNSSFIPPMGLDVFIDNYNNGGGTMFDEIQSSALGTDTNGNVPLLFWDDLTCEQLFFQLHGDDLPTSTPMLPLPAGGQGHFSYELTLPVSNPRTGTVKITAPQYLIDSWTLGDNSNLWVELGAATTYDRYSSTTCDQLVGGPDEDICDYIDDNCWGVRVSHLEAPIAALFELVNDGSADPTFGCDPLVGFDPGNIAVLRRGTCEFGLKSLNAEAAGATAVFLVNDRRCSGYPDSDFCTINMGPGEYGDLVTIPTIMVSFADGEPVISALEAGVPVAGAFGSTSTFGTSSYAFLSDASEVDPDNANSITASTTPVTAGLSLIFSNDFELGTTGGWSQTVP